MGSLPPTPLAHSTAFSPRVHGTQLSSACGFCDRGVRSSRLCLSLCLCFPQLCQDVPGRGFLPGSQPLEPVPCRFSIHSGKCWASSSPVFLVAHPPSSGSISTRMVDLLVVSQHFCSGHWRVPCRVRAGNELPLDNCVSLPNLLSFPCGQVGARGAGGCADSAHCPGTH